VDELLWFLPFNSSKLRHGMCIIIASQLSP